MLLHSRSSPSAFGSSLERPETQDAGGSSGEDMTSTPPRARGDHEPQGALRTLGGLFAIGFVTLPFAIIFAYKAPVPWVPRPLMVIAYTIAGGALARAFGAALFGGVWAMLGPIVGQTGRSTPYVHDFSQEQALVARGDVEAALALYERRMAESPADHEARLRAADVYAREAKDPARAAALFREVLRMPGVPAPREVYAVHRLVDLHAGALGDVGPALRELARLADRYPGTDVARDARAAIAGLKRREG